LGEEQKYFDAKCNALGCFWTLQLLCFTRDKAPVLTADERLLAVVEDKLMYKKIAIAITVIAVLAALPALSRQQNPTSTLGTAGTLLAAADLPAVRHFVYQFGYNTAAASHGGDTGTTTIDIVGLDDDGGMTVTATDQWWNSRHPKQTFTCEVYKDGGVKCPKAPYALSPIQVAVIPLLGQNYFAALSNGATSSWTQSYSIRATFAPGAGEPFFGQVNTWNCSYKMTGTGTVTKNGASLNAVQSVGTMKEQGGRYITIGQKADILFSPSLKMPAFVRENVNLGQSPSVSTPGQYNVELKLITP
jgi:hypothetical protein